MKKYYKCIDNHSCKTAIYNKDRIYEIAEDGYIIGEDGKSAETHCESSNGVSKFLRSTEEEYNKQQRISKESYQIW